MENRMFREQHPIRLASRELSVYQNWKQTHLGPFYTPHKGSWIWTPRFPDIPSFGDSPGRETIAQPAKDRHPFQARQWLAVGDPWWLFTQFVQFFGYRWFPDNWWDSTLRTSWRHSLPLSRRPMVVGCLLTRYATLIFSDSLNSLPV